MKVDEKYLVLKSVILIIIAASLILAGFYTTINSSTKKPDYEVTLTHKIIGIEFEESYKRSIYMDWNVFIIGMILVLFGALLIIPIILESLEELHDKYYKRR